MTGALRARAARVPTLREERRLLRSGHLLVGGMDEVGRGALAGPVTVGVVVIDAGVRTAPAGVRDSKLLSPAARQALAPRLRRWALSSAVGHAEPDEIDRYGIIAALRLAGRRALAALDVVPTCVLLDGSHDWLSLPRAVALPQPEGLFDLPVARRGVVPPVELGCEPVVTTQVKADLRCAAVAAASVLAKVERDAIMVARSADYPQYGWDGNKGYSAPEHAAALRRYGPSPQHRQSWSLPTVLAGDGGGTMPLDLGLVVVPGAASAAKEVPADLDGLADLDDLADLDGLADLAAGRLPGDEIPASGLVTVELRDVVLPESRRSEPGEQGLDLAGAEATSAGCRADGGSLLRHDGLAAR